MEYVVSKQSPINEDERTLDEMIRNIESALNGANGLEAKIIQLKESKNKYKTITLANRASLSLNDANQRAVALLLEKQGKAMTAITNSVQTDLRDIQLMSSFPNPGGQQIN